MKENGLFLLNVLLIALIVSLFSIIQSSSYLFNGLLPAPNNWIPALTFLSISRRPLEAIFSGYFILLFILPLTITSAGVLLLNTLIIIFTIRLIKFHVFWKSPLYFLIITSIALFTFFMSNFFLSTILGTHTGDWPPVLTWFSQIIITLPTSFIFFYLFSFIDTITQKRQLTENTSGKI